MIYRLLCDDTRVTKRAEFDPFIVHVPALGITNRDLFADTVRAFLIHSQLPKREFVQFMPSYGAIESDPESDIEFEPNGLVTFPDVISATVGQRPIVLGSLRRDKHLIMGSPTSCWQIEVVYRHAITATSIDPVVLLNEWDALRAVIFDRNCWAWVQMR